MKIKHTLVLFDQVKDYIAALPPDSKKYFKRELQKLAVGGGDTHPLKKELEGYSRLRIGAHRVIYMHASGLVIECAYAGPRETVYQTFMPPKTADQDSPA